MATTVPSPSTSTTLATPPGAANNDRPGGLTGGEARRRLAKFGPNAMPDTSLHPLRMALEKFWAPVPWMLEAAIVLELALGKYVEAAIIAVLLVFNAALGLFQEGRAQATLAALKSRLALNASVRRDGAWHTVPAAELVPGDLVKLSLGGVVAADMRLTEGEILLDQSMLTGESMPIEGGAGVETYAGALVRRGEAVAEVTATGARTKFGRTAELVRTAHVVSSQQKAVLRVVRNLAAVQRRHHRLPGGLCYVLGLPLARDHSPDADGGPGVDPRRAAGHLHPGLGARGARPGQAGRVADPALRRGRGGDDGRAVRRQDRHLDPQRAGGDGCSADAGVRRQRRFWRWPRWPVRRAGQDPVDGAIRAAAQGQAPPARPPPMRRN